MGRIGRTQHGRRAFAGLMVPRRARALVWMLAAILVSVSPAAEREQAEGSPPAVAAVPPSRQADSVVVITLREEITQVTAYSVQRRIKAAERAGASAIVIELDTPGGEVGAVLEICNALKRSTISNTVAWVNPDAYSGGAIIALACREIVLSEYATMGDALPVSGNPITFVQGLPEAERQKILAPLLAEVVDSARRSGYDEKLVQAFMSLGVELWLVEHRETGERYFIDEAEWAVLFDRAPPRTSPRVGSGGRIPEERRQELRDRAEEQRPQWMRDLDFGRRQQPGFQPDPADAPTPVPTDDAGDPFAFRPASPTFSEQLRREVSLGLEETVSPRPQFSGEDRGDYALVEYVTDGYTLLVLKTNELLRYGLGAAVVNNDEELRAFFGASTLVRMDKSWSEHLVSFLTNMWVRGLLVALFLLAMFLELVAPGVGVAGAVAGACLLGLLAPPLLIGAAGWWTVAAVVGGILLILAELFIVPGLTVFGVSGVVLMTAGLVGSFVNADSPQVGDQIVHGLAMVLLAFFVAGVGMYFTSRVYGSLPILNRLVLSGADADDETEGMLAAMDPAPHDAALARIGETGLAITPLRPAGTAQFEDRLVDVVCETGFVEKGAPVRVVAVTQYRVAVAPVEDGTDRATAGGTA